MKMKQELGHMKATLSRRELTRSQLSDLLFCTQSIFLEVWGVSPKTGYLTSIEREDGSGRSFNFKLTLNGFHETVYIRVVD